MRIGFFLGLLLLMSCNDLQVKKTSSEAILNEELKAFKWNEVDDYPSFETCDGSTKKEDKKRCFQSTLTQIITKQLSSGNIMVTEDLNDTIMLSFRINKTGELSLLNLDADSLTYQQIPDLKQMVRQGLDSLPKIYPAIKRGQQVTTEFMLPVIISVN